MLLQQQPVVEERAGPAQAHTHSHSAAGDSAGVLQGATNSRVAVHGYEHHVPHRGGGEGEIREGRQSAHEVTQQPAGLYEPQRFHRHHQQPDKQVGDGEGEQEQVGGGVKLPEVGDGGDDQQVESHGEHADAGEQRVEEDGLRASAL